jgi:predicted RNA binding protein YcfA (HicA-like mRNA interferase family)
MPKIGPVPPKKLVEILKHEGFQVVRTKGSHVILMKEGVRTVVPVHPGKDVKPGLVRAIIREAKLTRSRFFELLKEV